MGDVGRDLLGGVIGVLTWFAFHRRRHGLWIPAALLLAAGLAPLAFTGWAYAQRALHPEIIWEARRATWQVFLEPGADGTYSRMQSVPRLRFTSRGVRGGPGGVMFGFLSDRNLTAWMRGDRRVLLWRPCAAVPGSPYPWRGVWPG